MEKKLISINSITKNVGLSIDPVGFVFTYQGKIYRAINDSIKEDVLSLFDSGAVNELYQANLIPRTAIADIAMDGYELILQHDRIGVIIYPIEWSFSMLKDAALVVLQVNKILKKYGYETHDSHGYNILFDYSQPKYVDFGSFVKIKGENYWSGRDNFREFYLYPLYLWSKGNISFARSLLNNDGKYVTNKAYEFFIYKYSLARYLPQNTLKKLFIYLNGVKNIQKLDIENILIVKKEKLKRRFLRILMILSKWGVIPINRSDFSRLTRRIKKIKTPSVKTEWGTYHSKLVGSELFDKTNRFGLIIEHIRRLNIESVLEIAGNQGVLSTELSKYVKSVICSDFDEKAIDIMYQKARQSKAKIYPVLLDFLTPYYLNLYYSESYSVFKRYKAQSVLALALTHHLILTRKTPIDNIFQALSSYTEKYLFVEFMPLGLRRGDVPEWYNVDWFRSYFSKYFKLLVEVPTERDNSRILFIGEKYK
jgi:hypothetical protein